MSPVTRCSDNKRKSPIKRYPSHKCQSPVTCYRRHNRMSPVTRCSDNKCKSPIKRRQTRSLHLHGTQVSSVCLLLHIFSDHMVKSPVTCCQIRSLPLHVTQISSVRLLFSVTQNTWLSPVRRYSDQWLSLLLNVTRSEVSCYTLHRFQVYVSYSSLRSTQMYVPELHF